MGKRWTHVDDFDTDGPHLEFKRARHDDSPPQCNESTAASSRPRWTLTSKDIPAHAKKIYCILRGFKPGFYFEWAGPGGAEEQTKGFRGGLYAGFPKKPLKPGNVEQSVKDAVEYMNHDETCCKWNCGDKCRVERLYPANGVGTGGQVKGEKEAMEPKNPSLCRTCQEEDPAHGLKLCERCLRSPELSSASQACINDFSLVEEQATVLNLVARGQNVFFTGSAGTGKSRILKAITSFCKRTGLSAKVVAPTGIAALAVDGTTIHTYAGLDVKLGQDSLDNLRLHARKKEIWKRFLDTDVLIIDEISMVEADLLTRVSAMMDAALLPSANFKSFGGVQIVITGDFLQLPPVKPFRTCIDCAEEMEIFKDAYTCKSHGAFYDADKWAFKSPAWQNSLFTTIRLQQIHRQAEGDYTEILQRVREGVGLSADQVKALQSTDKDADFDAAIKLNPIRADVQAINDTHMNALPTPVHSYTCEDDFLRQPHHPEYAYQSTRASLSQHRYEQDLELKEGMRVLLLQNLDIDAGLVNGTQGIVTGFEEMNENKLPRAMNKSSKDVATNGEPLIRHKHRRYAEDFIRKFWTTNTGQCWPIVRFQNGLERVVFADCSITELGKDEPYSLLSRTQIPLIAGYAITIHKSQGMTLENVVVDLAKCFAPGQAYVALSRAKTLSGMTVQQMPRDMRPDLTVQAFMEETFGSPSVRTLDRTKGI